MENIKLSVSMNEIDIVKLKILTDGKKLSKHINLIIKKRIDSKDFKIEKTEGKGKIVTVYLDSNIRESLKTISQGNSMKISEVVRYYIVKEIEENMDYIINKSKNVDEKTQDFIVSIPVSLKHKLDKISEIDYLTKKNVIEKILKIGLDFYYSGLNREIELLAMTKNMETDEYIKFILSEEIKNNKEKLDNILKTEEMLLKMNIDSIEVNKYLKNMLEDNIQKN